MSLGSFLPHLGHNTVNNGSTNSTCGFKFTSCAESLTADNCGLKERQSQHSHSNTVASNSLSQVLSNPPCSIPQQHALLCVSGTFFTGEDVGLLTTPGILFDLQATQKKDQNKASFEFSGAHTTWIVPSPMQLKSCAAFNDHCEFL